MKPENRSFPRTRAARSQSLRTLWTAGLALIAVILVIARLNGTDSASWSKISVGLIVAVLLIRQVTRRRGSKGPKAAEPDPRSRLNLQ